MVGYNEDGKDILHEMYDGCELDNVTTFYSNGKFIDDEGAFKCDDEDPQETEGTWRIEGNNLIITGDALLALNLTIADLNETTLKLSGKNPFAEDDKEGILIYTFTAQ